MQQIAKDVPFRFGRLQKQSDVLRSWRERLLVLTADTLKYYTPDCIGPGVSVESQEGAFFAGALVPNSAPKGTFYIVDMLEVRRVASDKLAFCIVLRDRGGSLPAVLRSSEGGVRPRGGADKELLLQASSERDRDAWMKDIERAMYSPGRRVAALREATALLRSGVLCMRQWELVRACIAEGTEASLNIALSLLRRAEGMPSRARGSEALESLLVDLAMAYSEGALMGALAGLRRVAAREPCRSALQERLVAVAIAKYGIGRWLQDEHAAAAASPVPAESQDGLEAAVAALCCGALRVEFLDGTTGSSSGSGVTLGAGASAGGSGAAAAAAVAARRMVIPDAEWTQDVQDSFALTLHTIAATVQRFRVEKLRKKRAAAAPQGGGGGCRIQQLLPLWMEMGGRARCPPLDPGPPPLPASLHSTLRPLMERLQREHSPPLLLLLPLLPLLPQQLLTSPVPPGPGRCLGQPA